MRAWAALLVTLVVLAAAGRAEARASLTSRTLRELSCTSCHLEGSSAPYLYESFEAFKKAPPPQPTGCVQCHVSNSVAAAAPRPDDWLPLSKAMIERVRGFHAYVEAPAIVTSVELKNASGKVARLARFTACGLERFLASPVPRRGAARQSMFPLEPGRLRTLLTALAPELEKCTGGGASTPAAPAAQLERGRQLFVQMACATCHMGGGAGPRLRLGFPLLGRAYFGARVRQGAGAAAAPTFWQRRWQALESQVIATLTGVVQMPAYGSVSDADLDALYAYIGADASDVPVPARKPAHVDPVHVPDDIKLALFRDVQKRVFDTSCRHCHSPEARDQELIQSVFGKIKGSAPAELPMTRLQLAPSETLRTMLSPGPGCTDSQVVSRLKARVAEWTGRAVPGAPRGMPMTMPPLPDDVIRLVEAWSAVGCPSDRGDLCTACPTSASASHAN